MSIHNRPPFPGPLVLGDDCILCLSGQIGSETDPIRRIEIAMRPPSMTPEEWQKTAGWICGLAGAGVRVKPLVWKQRGNCWSARAGRSVYEIIDVRPGLWMVSFGLDESADYPTAEAAKAACFADHKARVLAMLEPAPAAPGVSRAVLEECAEALEIGRLFAIGRLRQVEREPNDDSDSRSLRISDVTENGQTIVRALAAARAELERPGQADARIVPAWVKCSERMPTKADADCFGRVWRAYTKEDPLNPGEWDRWEPELRPVAALGMATHWQPTGLRRPTPPQ